VDEAHHRWPDPDLAGLRRTYDRGALAEEQVAADPLDQFRRWMHDALIFGVPEPNAMVLATSSADGMPSARTVLLKGVTDEGFAFFTNYESEKAADLAANPRAALVFPWHVMERQVRVSGTVVRLSEGESLAYFRTRPRESQLGAWASAQSTVVSGRQQLDEAYAAVEQRFPADADVPKPPFWGGYRVLPAEVEFWQGRHGRLHDRLRYRRADQGWKLERLAP
jgi:pyridoxamine 5'-phosphate oxidase